MAYITADEVSAIRKELKNKFPQFKFGCRKSSGSLSVAVTIKSGPIDFISNFNEAIAERSRPNDPLGPRPVTNYLNVNPYWYKEHFTGEVADMIGEMIKIIKTAPDRKWYDNSDIQTDYFDTAYYFDLQVGSWERPYKVTV